MPRMTPCSKRMPPLLTLLKLPMALICFNSSGKAPATTTNPSTNEVPVGPLLPVLKPYLFGAGPAAHRYGVVHRERPEREVLAVHVVAQVKHLGETRAGVVVLVPVSIRVLG